MAKTTTSNISIRMDSNLKAAAEALYEELGMNISTAFNIFVRQSLRERGIPFKITEGSPNKETVSAMLEAERIAKDSTIDGYKNVDELFADLDAWVNMKSNIQPDWLLVYYFDNEVLVLTLARTGTHSDLFGL